MTKVKLPLSISSLVTVKMLLEASYILLSSTYIRSLFTIVFSSKLL